MSSRRSARQMIVVVMLGVLVGGGLMAITPAGAQVNQALETNWKKIWKKELKPEARKTFYTKKQSDSAFAGKAEAAAAAAAAQNAANAATDGKLGSYYKKTESDAKYAGVGSSYTKAESDAKYAPAQALYRGSLLLFDTAAAAASGTSSSFSFGATFPSAPTVHYIATGDPIPAGCSGTSAAPNAAAGHLCIFESFRFNVSTTGICKGGTSACSAADPFGASVFARSAAAGEFGFYGTWAARPSGPVTNPAFAPAPQGAVNQAAPSGASGGTPGSQ